LRLMRGFALSGSYSILGKGGSTFGLGWGIKAGPFNSFFISEYNPFRYDKVTKSGKIRGIIPIDMYGFSFRIGTNITFGCNRVKKLNRDTPIFKSTEWMY
jgi:hypothetical protein